MTNLRSPGITINEREISVVEEGVLGTPATILGVSQRGRAFVPTTVGNLSQLNQRFGGVTPQTPGLHGAFRFLEQGGQAVNFIRILGAGERSGFVLDKAPGTPANNTTNFFLSAQHVLPSNALPGLAELRPVLGVDAYDPFRLVRAQIILAAGWSLAVRTLGDTIAPTTGRSTDGVINTDGEFEIVLTPPAPGAPFVYRVSLQPDSLVYIARVLNSNTFALAQAGHVLWRHWLVDPSVATTTGETSLEVRLDAPRTTNNVEVNTGLAGTEPVCDIVGRFNDIYRDAVSPWVVSQPQSGFQETTNYTKTVTKLLTKRLFRFHTIDDGTSANQQVKVSITNISASLSEAEPFGSFNVVVRRWDDTDFEPNVLEEFVAVNLDPSSERYIARVIGDAEFRYDWSKPEGERRLIREGNYANRSNWVWVEMHPDVEDRVILPETLPFGYEAPRVQRINDQILPAGADGVTTLPVLFRKKLTVGTRNLLSPFAPPTQGERVESRLHWGVQWERQGDVDRWNSSREISPAVGALCAYPGSDTLNQVLGAKEARDAQESEFSLAFVTLDGSLADLRSKPVSRLARSAYYVRGSEIAGISGSSFIVTVPGTSGPEQRFTLASLLVEDRRLFNRFTGITKFTLPLQGGWDGLNPFWREVANMTDFASGVLAGEDTPPGMDTANGIGVGTENIVVQSLLEISNLATDTQFSSANLIATPGYREPVIADSFAELVREKGFMLYIQDVPAYNEDGDRIWTGSTDAPDVSNTVTNWSARRLDNNFAAAYFPDVVAPIPNGRGVVLPASVAALSAIAFNDSNSFPWFAPAGFNRGALPWVRNPIIRLRKPDRDTLYDDAHINPLFTGEGSEGATVVLGQRTLQQAVSALDRINVRRAIIEAKRILRDNMLRFGIFEQNDAETRSQFTQRSLEQLGVLLIQNGARSIRVICDESNNTELDVRNRTIRATCVFVPTRFAENIVFDVVISPTGDFSSIER